MYIANNIVTDVVFSMNVIYKGRILQKQIEEV